MTEENPWAAMWRVLSPTFNFPASGDIGSFSYHPNTLWEAPSWIRGNPEMESGIYREVASPGSQLGTLIDAVCLLIEQQGGHDHEEGAKEQGANKVFERTLGLRDAVDQHKKIMIENRLDTLKKELKQLQEADPEGFSDLMKSVE